MANEILGLTNKTTGAGVADADARYAAIANGVTNGNSHDHNGGDGAAIIEAAIALDNNTTNDVSDTKHGFFPKLPSIVDNKTYGIKNGVVTEVVTSGPSLSFYAECILIDATAYSNGYVTLTNQPATARSVMMSMVGGVKQVNRDAIGSSTAVGDFSVDSTLSLKKVYIKNGVSGGPTDLSNDIQTNDILIFEYPY